MRNSLVILFFLLCFSVISQEKSEIIQQRIEFISEQNETEELDLTNIFDQLNYFYENPINLNNTTNEELQSLGLLTDIQISEILLHKEQFGNYISIYELQSLKYLDLEIIQLILPFVFIDNRLDQLHITFKEAIKNGNFEVFTRYQLTPEDRKGYSPVSDSIKQSSNSYYYGSPDRFYTRFRYTYRTNLSAGITAEKDPGEELFKGSQKKTGFDYYSYHAFYKGGKYFKAVALGDYQIQIGQGLNTWSGYAFGKTADIFSSKKTANYLRPYTSADENRFFRGAATNLGYKNFNLIAWYSSKKVDGTVQNDSLASEFEFVSTIDLTGFHRTTSEIAKKDQLREQVYGSYLAYNTARFNWGIAAVNQSYSTSLLRDTSLYNLYQFRGKSTTTYSSDFNFVLKNSSIFGEVAYASHSKAFAQLYGIMTTLDPRLSVSLIYRDYDRAYHSFYNNGFAEGSQTQNEKGLFMGAKWKLNSSWSLSTYADIFKFPWLKYQVDAPSEGYEFLFQPTYKPNKIFELYGRFRTQVRQKNSRNSDETITEIENVVQNNYRINLSYKVSDGITFKSRLEYTTINRLSNNKEEGWLFSTDLQFQPKMKPFDISARFSLFDTDSYDSRIYTYENNALYVFSSPSYYYQGSRAYLLFRYSFLRQFDLWIRYGTFIYSNKTVISSGSEEILGNQKSDITIQLRWKI